jgi:hypothetical protein
VKTITPYIDTSPRFDQEIVEIESDLLLKRDNSLRENLDPILPKIPSDLLENQPSENKEQEVNHDHNENEMINNLDLYHKDDDYYKKGLILKPTLILDGIFRHQNEVESKRQADLGSSSSELAENAYYEIRRLAWESNWEELTFVKEVVKSKSNLLEWNCFIGFITQISDHKYRFYSSLANHFFAASYLFIIPIPLQKKAKRKIKENQFSFSGNRITQLFNELCIQNGRSELTIKLS